MLVLATPPSACPKCGEQSQVIDEETKLCSLCFIMKWKEERGDFND